MIDCEGWLENAIEGWLEEAAEDWNVGSPGGLCCTWGLQRIYRSIAEGKETVIAMVDDAVLPYDWHQINEMTNLIGDFNIFQLFTWSPRHYEVEVDETEDFHYIQGYPNPMPVDPRISYGLAGLGDNALAITPAGARNLLDAIAERPFWTVEFAMHFYARTQPNKCYSLNYYLPEFIEQVTNFELKLSDITHTSDTEIKV